MKAVVFTLGCRVNSYESGVLAKGLESIGYEVSEKLGYADLYILNTCAVTAEAEKKSRQAIARIRAYNKNARIIVTGCASQKNPKSFSDKEGVTLVTGAKSKEKILKLLSQEGVFVEEKDEYACGYTATFGKTRCYVKIQDGCNNFCSYCIIPYLRGRSRSRDIDEVVKEVQSFCGQEVVLTGINVSDYNYNGQTLADVIARLEKTDKRIRLSSLEVGVIDERLLENLKKLKHFSQHFHLSLQSGSDSVLKSMNRHYTSKEYFDKVCLIRKYFPLCAITTDVIVGYATEGEKEFEESLEFCKKVEFADIHCFPYSPRELTVGAKLKDNSPAVKKARMDKILSLKKQLKQLYFEKCRGEILDFIPEEKDGEYTVGTTGNYIKCKVLGDIDKVIKVRLTEYGEICLAEKEI